jgi:hypothetical protein
MPETRNPMRWPRLGTAIYLAVLAVAALYAYRQPTYNRDMLFYMGDAYVLAGASPCQAQARVYEELRSIPPAAYQNLTEATELDRTTKANCDSYAQQLRFYKIRVAYLELANLLRVFGFSTMHALRLISTLSLVGIGLVLFAWTRPFLSPVAAPVLCTPVVLSFGHVARTDSADMLATLVILTALFLIAEKGRLLSGFALFLLCVFIRTETILVMLAVLACLFTQKKLGLGRALAWAGAAVVSVLLLNHLTGNYGWAMEFKESFFGMDAFPAQIHPVITPAMYIDAFGRQAIYLLNQLMPFAILIALAVVVARRFRRLLWFVLLAALAKFLLYPVSDPRHYTVQVLVAFVALAAELGPVLAITPREASRSQGS